MLFCYHFILTKINNNNRIYFMMSRNVSHAVTVMASPTYPFVAPTCIERACKMSSLAPDDILEFNIRSIHLTIEVLHTEQVNPLFFFLD